MGAPLDLDMQMGGGTKRSSEIWRHFQAYAEDRRFAVCKLCQARVSRGRDPGHLTNSGMIWHYKRARRPTEKGKASAPSTRRGGGGRLPLLLGGKQVGGTPAMKRAMPLGPMDPQAQTVLGSFCSSV